MVLSNAPSCIVARSNHKLPEAAARRSALPRKRKPSPDIFSNTNAVNEAAAESALAVCAAQRRFFGAVWADCVTSKHAVAVEAAAVEMERYLFAKNKVGISVGQSRPWFTLQARYD